MKILKFDDFVSEGWDPKKAIAAIKGIVSGKSSGEKSKSSPSSSATSISGYGKFTEAEKKSSPLVVVFGGIPVGGRESGSYMYDYFDKTKKKYNLFVAKSHRVDGPGSYSALESKLKEDGIDPSKKILYLFSGGYNPGMSLLKKVGAKEFDKIYLVDIWMGNQTVSDFYKDLASSNPNKVEYYYTQGGSANPSAAKSIAGSVSKKSEGNQGHMATNNDAIKSLESYS